MSLISWRLDKITTDGDLSDEGQSGKSSKWRDLQVDLARSFAVAVYNWLIKTVNLKP